ncbi:MAG TPA: GNAT family N-acetyltransferase [Lachnospiraceae bacterium]|nr:GNAT family N-acetyltransferase [Lachnospiraceae bacterium]
MIFRKAMKNEIEGLFMEGYKVWSKNRSFEQYCIDNGKEDAYGTRYVIDENGEIVSSMILLNLKSILERKVYGIGSVITPKLHGHKGYASKLLTQSIEEHTEKESIIFLYSDVHPSFYEQFLFRALPDYLQKGKSGICMVRCEESIWSQLIKSPLDIIPDYF